VTKTCLQCGGVQPSNVRVCNFCESSLVVENASEGASLAEAQASLREEIISGSGVTPATDQESAWRGELSHRLQAYRARRRRVAPNLAQAEFSFEASNPQPPAEAAVVVQESPPADDPDFSFTIAIGRNAATREDSRMVIDLSAPPEPPDAEQTAALAPASATTTEEAGLFPAASIEERRIAGLIDAGCLFFAYGAFLTLFGSLGGQFTFSKLSAVVCLATFVIVYLQYFALFTVFGGTTPGMMLRGLHVVSFSGETPSPRQMLWRSLGYMLSAGTLFMGFLWALWDEDGLTWHDRLSRTYLCPAPTFADIDATHAAHSR
jgi:uncharacterized RDD family membrane protein YckC